MYLIKSLKAVLAAAVAVGVALGAQADQTKANNNTALQSGGSWVSGTAPGSGDNAIWNATVSTPANCTNTLGSAVTWKGIAITNPSAPVTINGSTTLTLNNGINMASATVNFNLVNSTTTLASNQTWTVASGRTLTTGSSSTGGRVQNNTVTLTGGGTWTTSGTDDNGNLGVVVSSGTFNLNKTSSSGTHAVGGPGMTVNSGATARLTGTGGDQIYNGGSVTDNGTLDLDGNSEAVNGLSGAGTVTTSLSGGAPTLTLGASGSGGTFTGTIQAGASGSITVTEAGTGTQSIGCITRGSGTAGPTINANAGTLILNGTADNAFATATVASNAVLQLAKTSSSGAHAIGFGLTINNGGLVQITGTGGDQIYNGNDVTNNGTLDLYGNSESINGLDGSGTVTTTTNGGTPTLTLGASNDSGAFTGTIEAGTNGSITVTEAGTGTQSIGCITRGSGTAGPTINANAGTLILNGTADNAFATATVASNAVLQLAKTSTSSAHAIGSGLTINAGGRVQITGTGGDQIYNGNDVTNNGTLDLYGNSESINGLNGSGTVTTTTNGGTPTLTLGAGNDSGVFTGTIQAGASGSITVTEAGTGTQSIACITQGSGTSGPTINANAGTLILNGSVDNVSAGATVASGATLLLDKTSSGSVHAIGGGGLTVNSGGTAQLAGTGGDQIYNGASVSISGTFDLKGNSETVGSLSFNGGTLQDSYASGTLTDSGTLTMNGNVAVNELDPAIGTTVLLRYSGARSGSGSFVAGNLPGGATVSDNTSAQTVSVVYAPTNGAAVMVSMYNTNQVVVAITTPYAYGAHGDGITDDSAAFQAAMNAVNNHGGHGGGVVYVPAGNYAFTNNLTIPTGVTLHGDWTDWTTGTNGLVGTTFKVYVGAGQGNGTPFISMDGNGSAALQDVNIWYPNQNPNSITPYPFSVALSQDGVVRNVVLVNSYQGIQGVNSAENILSTVIGTPLYLGANMDLIYDICHSEDIRFSPAVWPASGLTNAPSVGGAYATWMRANGTGMQMVRVDGDLCMDVNLSGYNVGIMFTNTGNGDPGCTFYNGSISNCANGIMAQNMPGALGLAFANFIFDDDIAVNRTRANTDANILFDHCTLIGRAGTAVSSTGNDSGSWMQFQNCTISNTLNLAGPGVFNVVDSTLNASTQCVMSASATRAAFTGCTLNPAQNIVNNGNVSNLLVKTQQSISNTFPVVDWTNVAANYLSRKPAKTTLFVTTSYGTAGNGTTDDTAAIQKALAAASANGGGIVYVPAGKYHLTNTLDVPGGVELRGAYEMRHSTQPDSDGHEKGTILQPYGGQGTTNGPAAITLEANAGLIGVTISYETQSSNCIPFPPAIQGRGGNVYAIAVQCPNPYIYMDLDSYTCTNHFVDMADGWAIYRGYLVGNGSSGTIADCHGNWTFWIDNGDSASSMPQSDQPPVTEFTSQKAQMYVLGNCTELMVKDFNIIENSFIRFVAEGGKGPNATLIGDYCDATSGAGLFLDAAAPCTITGVNTPMAVFNWNNDANLATASVGVQSTTNFQGVARFFNTLVFAGDYQDFDINGGDVGLDAVHSNNGNTLGAVVNGGAFHLVNCSATLGSPAYGVNFGANAGVAGKTNEVIGNYAYQGINYVTQNVSDPVNVWNDYALSSYTVLNIGPVVVGDFYPNGLYQFQPSSTLAFQAYSANGINNSGITVQLTGTNLLGQAYATNYTSANGLSISGSSTDKSVSAPLAPNTVYAAIVQVTDASGYAATNVLAFDTITPAYTFEAEDFDYNSGNYINNPQTNAYAGLTGTAGIDYSNGIPTQGNGTYRPKGLATENAGDIPRQAYATSFRDYDVGNNSGGSGNWGNYTRSFPSGTYNIYLRSSSMGGSTSDSESMYLVTSGRGTSNQTTSLLGTFNSVNTGGWQTYTWLPLLDTNSNLVKFTGGSLETLRVATVNGGNNLNFYLLVATNTQGPLLLKSVVAAQPVVLQMQTLQSPTGQSLTLQWLATGTGKMVSQANLYYTPSLAPPVTWVLVTNTPVLSNGNWTVTLPVGTSSSGFYQLQ